MEEEIKLAEKIYECRKNIMNIKEQEKDFIEKLKIALNGETKIPDICEFRTYEGTTVLLFNKDYKGP